MPASDTIQRPGFLDTLAEFDTAVGLDRIFGADDGTPIARIRAAMRSRDPQYELKVTEASELYTRALIGNRTAVRMLSEALSRDDFPLYFGDVLQREMIPTYETWPSIADKIAMKRTANDFRSMRLFAFDGLNGILDPVAELDEYTAEPLEETRYTFSVSKYGRAFAVSWETLINDDLDAFRDVPARLAEAARQTEDWFATGLIVDVNGPNAAFFTTGQGNRLTSNPILSITSLQDALTAFSAMTNPVTGLPIVVTGAKLIIPPSLRVVAENLLRQIHVDINIRGGDTDQRVRTENWIASNIELVQNPWITARASTANGTTSWFLMADPNSTARPAAVMGKLRGHETPQLFRRAPNAIPVGAAGADVTAGSFENDSDEWKVRHVLGGTLVDYRACVASNGSGV